jgi:hypothetical protein
MKSIGLALSSALETTRQKLCMSCKSTVSKRTPDFQSPSFLEAPRINDFAGRPGFLHNPSGITTSVDRTPDFQSPSFLEAPRINDFGGCPGFLHNPSGITTSVDVLLRAGSCRGSPTHVEGSVRKKMSQRFTHSPTMRLRRGRRSSD